MTCLCLGLELPLIDLMGSKIASNNIWSTHLGTTGDTSEADGLVSIDVEGSAGDWLCGRRVAMVLERNQLVFGILFNIDLERSI